MTPEKFSRLTATFFYAGYVPLAPGSLASILGVFIYAAVYQNAALYVTVTALLTVLGFYVSGQMEGFTREKDPSCVVIDEVCGMLVALFLLPVQFPVLITAFFLFRACDMFKVYPTGRLELLPGGIGIMIDDLIAGVYTNVVMHTALIVSKAHFH